jgi:probable F420-dependent oxidoreductase
MASLGVRLRDSHLTIHDMRDLAQLAEGHGYESLWLPEGQGREAITEMTSLVLATERIQVGTGIVSVFARLPTVAAAAIATAAALAPGRVILGLGIGHQAAVEHAHGIRFARPFQQTREFATIARGLLREGSISYAGDIYNITRYQLDTTPSEPVPVFLAALRPQMLHLAGALADGVLMNWATPAYIPQAIEHIRQGAESAGRQLSDIHIASYLRTCVTETPDVVEHACRVQIARYGSMPYYQHYFGTIGFAAEADTIAQAWSRGDAEAAQAAVTLPMIRAVTIYGSAEECRQRLQAYREAGLHQPIIAPFPIGEPIKETFARTIEGCAP